MISAVEREQPRSTAESSQHLPIGGRSRDSPRRRVGSRATAELARTTIRFR